VPGFDIIAATYIARRTAAAMNNEATQANVCVAKVTPCYALK